MAVKAEKKAKARCNWRRTTREWLGVLFAVAGFSPWRLLGLIVRQRFHRSKLGIRYGSRVESQDSFVVQVKVAATEFYCNVWYCVSLRRQFDRIAAQAWPGRRGSQPCMERYVVRHGVLLLPCLLFCKKASYARAVPFSVLRRRPRILAVAAGVAGCPGQLQACSITDNGMAWKGCVSSVLESRGRPA